MKKILSILLLAICFSGLAQPISNVTTFTTAATDDYVMMQKASGASPARKITAANLFASVASASLNNGPLFFAKAATTSTLTAVTYLTNTITATANGRIAAQDGITLTLNDFLLVKNQSDTLQNGIYFILDTGTAGTPYKIVRDSAYNETAEIYPSQVNVLSGTVNATKYFLQTTVDPVVGTSKIKYSSIATPTTTALNIGNSNLALTGHRTLNANGKNLTFDGFNTTNTFRINCFDIGINASLQPYGQIKLTASKLGFYDTYPVTKPGAVTTAQGIATALTSLGLLTTSTITANDLFTDAGAYTYLTSTTDRFQVGSSVDMGASLGVKGQGTSLTTTFLTQNSIGTETFKIGDDGVITLSNILVGLPYKLVVNGNANVNGNVKLTGTENTAYPFIAEGVSNPTFGFNSTTGGNAGIALQNTGTDKWTIQNNALTSNTFRIYNNATASDNLNIFANKNITINSSTDLGAGLGIKGPGSTSGTFNQRNYNSAGTLLYELNDAGSVGYGTSPAPDSRFLIKGADGSASNYSFGTKNGLGVNTFSIRNDGRVAINFLNLPPYVLSVKGLATEDAISFTNSSGVITGFFGTYLSDGVIGLYTNAGVNTINFRSGSGLHSFFNTGFGMNFGTSSNMGYTVGVTGTLGITGQFNMQLAAPLAIKSGTNQRAGNATLVGGTVTVSNTTVTANTLVVLTRKTSGGTVGMAVNYTLTAGTSFTITSDNALDTSTYTYFLIESN